MKFCSKCGKELCDEAIICTGCGCSVEGTQGESDNDKISVGLCILAALIPLFGLIYWAIKHKEKPTRAKACGITALISWGIGIVLTIVWSTVFSFIVLELLYLFL